MGLSTRQRLGREALRYLPAGCGPLVRPGEAGTGIVHIGLGAFHRAHQAVYTEQAIAAAGGDWAITAVAPRSVDVVTALSSQDNLFSVTAVDGSGARARVVGVLAEVRHAASDPGAILRLLARDEVRVVTLTVTEKAYQLDHTTGRLHADAELTADLTTDRPPRTVAGLLVRGLIERARAGAAPLAMVSCDNLPGNGERLRALVEDGLTLAGAAPAVTEWVRAQVRFPSTMVDRIVPASTAATRERAAGLLGVEDAAAVAAEPFSQWVIEDDFPAGRPAWEAGGATFTADARPWEQLKLRALNAVHSGLAYLGALAGAPTIADALVIPGLHAIMVRLLADDVAPSLCPPDGVTVAEYGHTVLERFANPAMAHRTLQVAMDGSQKLPQRLLPTLLERRRQGAVPRWGALLLAAWLRFGAGRADSGSTLPLDDPRASDIRAALATADPVPTTLALLSPELADDAELCAIVAHWLDALTRHGVRGSLAGAAA